MKNVRGRISQHLGGGYFQTYSLHLSQWDQNLDYDLDIEIFTVKTPIESTHQRGFIELIKQELWDHFQPVFGKKSGL